MRIGALLLALALVGCSKGPSPPDERPESSPPTPLSVLPDSLARSHELVESLELQALGTEPFWSVGITRSGIVYRDPERLEGIRFPYAAPSREDSVLVFESSRSDSMPYAIRVSIRERECSDGMSDLRYRYMSEVRLDSLELRGCARYRSVIAP